MRLPAARQLTPALALLAAFPLGPAGSASAHDGVDHATATEAATHAAAPAESGPPLPFPVEIEVRFALTDQTGRAVTEADFRGRPMALFFGYASCQSICDVALPRMGAAIEMLGAEGAPILPVMITVDPARDTPAALAQSLPRHHPRMVGLTGPAEALAAARRAFQVQVAKVADDPEGGPIYAHGSFVYLIDADGRVVSVLPPILGPERMAEIMRQRLLMRSAPQG